MPFIARIKRYGTRLSRPGPEETYPGIYTRKLYMAATRAGQRLVITYVGELPEVIQSILTS